MANVAHSTLTGSNLHENKGVSSATDNTVATASSGSTVWQKLTASHLTGTGNSFGSQLLHVRDSANLSMSTTGSWVQRPLDTAVTNEISSASLTSNQISLPAGTYFVMADLTGNIGFGGYSTGYSLVIQGRLYNVTTSSAVVYSNPFSFGLATNSGGSSPTVGFHLPIIQRFTLAGTTTLEFQHYTTHAVTSTTVPGGTVINTQAAIWKIS